jgi:hypothetical protein
MIDSAIWKEKLEQNLTIMTKRQNQRRWSTRSIVLFERELMMVFFSIRALIEAGKLTDQISHKEYKFLTYPNKGKTVDDYTKYFIDDLFNLNLEVEKTLTLKMLTHQFIHAYVIFTEFSEEGKINAILLSSDREKKNSLIKIPISFAIEIINDVLEDDVTSIHFERNYKTGELRKTKIF